MKDPWYHYVAVAFGGVALWFLVVGLLVGYIEDGSGGVN